MMFGERGFKKHRLAFTFFNWSASHPFLYVCISFSSILYKIYNCNTGKTESKNNCLPPPSSKIFYFSWYKFVLGFCHSGLLSFGGYISKFFPYFQTYNIFSFPVMLLGYDIYLSEVDNKVCEVVR